jgi:hypothetical protein
MARNSLVSYYANRCCLVRSPIERVYYSTHAFAGGFGGHDEVVVEEGAGGSRRSNGGGL